MTAVATAVSLFEVALRPVYAELTVETCANRMNVLRANYS